MMTNDDILRIPEMCERLHISESTLYRWRRNGIGPLFFTEGRNIFYRWSDVQKWIHGVTTDGYTD